MKALSHARPKRHPANFDQSEDSIQPYLSLFDKRTILLQKDLLRSFCRSILFCTYFPRNYSICPERPLFRNAKTCPVRPNITAQKVASNRSRPPASTFLTSI